MTPARSISASSAGFSLVETLIAVAIIASMMAMTFSTISTNALSMRAMIDRRAAVLVARSALDTAAASITSVDVPSGGQDGDLQWRLVVAPYLARVGNAPPVDLVTVTVTNTATDRPVLRMRTLRLRR